MRSFFSAFDGFLDHGKGATVESNRTFVEGSRPDLYEITLFGIAIVTLPVLETSRAEERSHPIYPARTQYSLREPKMHPLTTPQEKSELKTLQYIAALATAWLGHDKLGVCRTLTLLL